MREEGWEPPTTPGPQGVSLQLSALPVSSQADQPPGVEGALCSGFNAPEAALLSASARPLLGFLLAAAQRELTSERKGVQCPHAAPAPMRGSPAAALSQDRTEPTSKEGRAAGGAARGRTRGGGGGHRPRTAPATTSIAAHAPCADAQDAPSRRAQGTRPLHPRVTGCHRRGAVGERPNLQTWSEGQGRSALGFGRRPEGAPSRAGPVPSCKGRRGWSAWKTRTRRRKTALRCGGVGGGLREVVGCEGGARALISETPRAPFPPPQGGQ